MLCSFKRLQPYAFARALPRPRRVYSSSSSVSSSPVPTSLDTTSPSLDEPRTFTFSLLNILFAAVTERSVYKSKEIDQEMAYILYITRKSNLVENFSHKIH
ncbi:hypothetical protein TWF506_000235 [Arthrobotrys conoides]|uniref:Uncharacterized protein n=1 Tax=Arthrobotrys conoides TaxID=74498 RepID=A0AAN8NZT6_9PEZI